MGGRGGGGRRYGWMWCRWEWVYLDVSEGRLKQTTTITTRMTTTTKTGGRVVDMDGTTTKTKERRRQCHDDEDHAWEVEEEEDDDNMGSCGDVCGDVMGGSFVCRVLWRMNDRCHNGTQNKNFVKGGMSECVNRNLFSKNTVKLNYNKKKI